MLCIKCSKETSNPKFCSRSCSVSYSNHAKPKVARLIAKCSFCKKDFHAKRPKQQHCTIDCQRQHRINTIETNGAFMPSWNNNKSIRNYLIQKHGNLCMICGQCANNWNGKPITLIVDHINGKANDNTLSNIRIICPNCDCQLLTYKGRNRGNSTRTYTITQKSKDQATKNPYT